MRNRVVRLSIVLLLVGAAAGGAYIVRADIAPSVEEGATRELDQQTDRLLTLVGDLTATQVAYFAPSPDYEQALERVPGLLREVMSVSGHVAASLRSDEAGAQLRTVVDETSALAHADASAREHLLVGDMQMAAHVIFGDGRRATRAITEAVLALRAAERQSRIMSAASDVGKSGKVLAAVAALWAVGLIVLALVPAAARKPTVADNVIDAGPPADAALPAAAELCAQIARVETATQLIPLLERAVTVLGADTIVVWMSAGETLHPVATAGTAAIPSTRRSSIERADSHPVATAWAHGSLETRAGEEGEPGVLAMPLFAGALARGVLSVHLRGPLLESPTVRAIATLIAAQLSTVVAGGQESAIGNRESGSTGQEPGTATRALSSA